MRHSWSTSVNVCQNMCQAASGGQEIEVTRARFELETSGAGAGTRTPDPRFKRPLLFQAELRRHVTRTEP